MICSFSDRMTSTSKLRFSTSDLAKTFSASVAVSPSAAFRTCSRSSAVRSVSTCGFDLNELSVEIFQAGQGVIDDRDLLLQLLGQLEDRGEHHNRLVRGAQRIG